MAIVIRGLHCKKETKSTTFVMDRVDNNMNCEHVIDIRSSLDASSSSLNSPSQRQDQSSTTVRNPIGPQTPTLANGSNSRNSLSIRRENGNGRRRRSPLNSGVWISVELVLTVCQIVAAIVVLSLSKHESSRAPLFGWIVGYASGCAATLPLLYWRWYYRNQASENGIQNRQGSSQNISASVSNLSNTRNSEGTNQPIGSFFRGPQAVRTPNPRIKELVEYFKMALDCFFAVWFVVGNVWIFGGHTSPSEAPNLYRLCIVFLTFSCIGYAMPFILCATICCCLPCILSVMGFREDINQNRGASSESINSLPIYKFKMKKASNSGRENNSAAVEGGVVAAGTEKERAISGEDAVCCICLAKYANNDELRELPCIHFFHKDCVDKWLKINASCPLCKGEVGDSTLSSVAGASAL